MLELTKEGLFCARGGFHVDPSRSVDVAVVTHAHSDHARRGSRLYYCADTGVDLLRRRVGDSAKIIGIPYRKPIVLGQVTVSLHPAGHILGSAQVRIEADVTSVVTSNNVALTPKKSVWVVSGDYKRASDPTCEPFEVVPCDTFVTEATFGNPRYHWSSSDRADPMNELMAWWQGNRSRGVNSILFCYSLGKAQRVLGELASRTDETVYVFGEAAELTEIYRRQGVQLVRTARLNETDVAVESRSAFRGKLIIAPHALNRTHWMRWLHPHETAFASGWMQTGAFGMGSGYDRGFILSDHADWPGLLKTIAETGARRVVVLHASEGKALVKHLRRSGLKVSVPEIGGPLLNLTEQPQLELFD